ncbi:MAG: ATP-binding cassette domain-containing protein [Bacillota bacterium]|nr:ATP-binding cassette domain-containing protein [Bacillota bacterium]
MLKLTDVSKHYDNKHILNRLNLHFEGGRLYVITGESGSGKTTLLRILMGLEEYEGEIVWREHAKAAVFQEDRLLEHLSALRNIRLVQQRTAQSAHDISADILALQTLNLGEDLHTPAEKLSGGMRRRVAIIRALESGADVLFFDEALKGLDEKNRARTLEYIRQKIAGKTVFWVTHDRSELTALGPCTIYHLADGQLRLN